MRHEIRLSISFGGIGHLSMEDCPICFSKELGFWLFCICVLDFVFSIDPFWRSMFLRLRGAHISFNHAFV